MVRACVLLAAAAIAAGCGQDDERRAPDPRPAVVWAVGDAATDTEQAQAVARIVRRGRVDRLLYLGDVYESGTLREFRRHYEPLYGALARKTAPVVGNHEHGNRRRGYEVYWREKLGRTPEPWYTLRAGGWELLALDSELPHDGHSPQLRWLRRQLIEPTTCRIAFAHRARYSAGQHGDQPDMAPLWEALRRRAVIFLSGHDHALERLKPIDGMVQLVSGAGGRPLYPVDESDDRLAFADDEHFGALRLELRPGAADFAFVAASGRVLDRGTLRCATASGGSS